MDEWLAQVIPPQQPGKSLASAVTPLAEVAAWDGSAPFSDAAVARKEHILGREFSQWVRWAVVCSFLTLTSVAGAFAQQPPDCQVTFSLSSADGTTYSGARYPLTMEIQAKVQGECDWEVEPVLESVSPPLSHQTFIWPPRRIIPGGGSGSFQVTMPVISGSAGTYELRFRLHSRSIYGIHEQVASFQFQTFQLHLRNCSEFDHLRVGQEPAFGGVPVGESREQLLDFRHFGRQQPVTVSSVSLRGGSTSPFSICDGPTSFTIEPRGFGPNLKVCFKPPKGLFYDDYIDIRSNDLCEPLVSVRVTGSGSPFETTPTPSRPDLVPRACCLLLPSFLQLGELGIHGEKDKESYGLIYTARAGFVDIAHLRDYCDITKHVYDQIVASNGAKGTKVVTEHGHAVLTQGVPDAGDFRIKVARAIAYDDSLGYEIAGYGVRVAMADLDAGLHNSSFSPEDLCSNYLGTLVAERAIKVGGDFNAAVTRELDNLIDSLGGRDAFQSREAFNRINKRWVDYDSSISLDSHVHTASYLKRRNFRLRPWQTGHPSDLPVPEAVFPDRPVPDGALAPLSPADTFYTYTHERLLRAPGTPSGPGTDIPKSDFLKQINRIRVEARNEYGVEFETP